MLSLPCPPASPPPLSGPPTTPLHATPTLPPCTTPPLRPPSSAAAAGGPGRQASGGGGCAALHGAAAAHAATAARPPRRARGGLLRRCARRGGGRRAAGVRDVNNSGDILVRVQYTEKQFRAASPHENRQAGGYEENPVFCPAPHPHPTHAGDSKASARWWQAPVVLLQTCALTSTQHETAAAYSVWVYWVTTGMQVVTGVPPAVSHTCNDWRGTCIEAVSTACRTTVADDTFDTQAWQWRSYPRRNPPRPLGTPCAARRIPSCMKPWHAVVQLLAACTPAYTVCLAVLAIACCKPTIHACLAGSVSSRGPATRAPWPWVTEPLGQSHSSSSHSSTSASITSCATCTMGRAQLCGWDCLPACACRLRVYVYVCVGGEGAGPAAGVWGLRGVVRWGLVGRVGWGASSTPHTAIGMEL